MLKLVDAIRRETSHNLHPERKSELGQFMTPASVAEFMASLFANVDYRSVRLLDAGAGLGSLSIAFIEQAKEWDADISKVTIEAFEIDLNLQIELDRLLSCLKAIDRFEYSVEHADFIEEAAHRILFERRQCYTHAILNPPYRKINGDSRHRSLLRSVGIETVNLYSAFIALAIKLLEKGGQLVAIVPRSFCNGPYYKSFRAQIFSETAVRHIHLFGSRTKAFKDDDVLQENVIIVLEKGGEQDTVTITTSTDATFSDLETHCFPFTRIRYPNDPESFLHIPTSSDLDFHETSDAFGFELSDLLMEVSTGPVVDFRLREHTTALPSGDSAPLLYPTHFEGKKIVWPRQNWKKPNAISVNDETLKWLYPTGYYTVTRRFSSKEEKRRIRAYVVDPAQLPASDWLGFENHFNVFHFRKRGIAKDVAYGLCAFLNSTAVDKYFRRMNGHTQVNATDLRRLRYPSLSSLMQIGRTIQNSDETDQDEADRTIELVLESQCSRT